MIASLAITILIQNSTLSSLWFPRPTGANGYEDYVKAADMISTPEDAAYNSFKLTNDGFGGFPSVPVSYSYSKHAAYIEPRAGEEQSAIPLQLKPGDLSAICTLASNKYGAVLGLIRSGNTKPLLASNSVFDTEAFMMDLCPFFQSLGNIAMRSAYGEFINGHASSGAQILMDELSFADRLSRVGPTGWTVGGEISNSATSMFHSVLKRLDLKDCTALDTYLMRLLAETPSARDQAMYRYGIWLQRISHDVQKVSSTSTGDYGAPLPGGVDDKALDETILKLSSSQRQDLISKAQAMAQTATDQYVARFDKPEKDWLGPMPPNQLFLPQGVGSRDDTVIQVAFRSMPKSARVTTILSVTQRMRLRLLDISAKIFAFEWGHYRLPKSLDEITVGLSKDPLSGQPYVYKTLSDGGFDLASMGLPDTGAIRLIPTPVKSLMPPKANP